MGDTKELKKIKKIYGEKFKNLCRELFPIIIEQEGTLIRILEKRFSHNCNSLYEAITENGLELEFKEFIFSEFDLKRDEPREEKRTPYEILEEKGYDLIECKTEEDIQGFRKYYAPDEVLCTIYNGGRLGTRDCFFAVRKDVDKIKREDFKKPNKEDEYSLSVLGIQFTREGLSTVQIISRYNHTVPNPNCTLGNDLDRLAPGLSQSFSNLLKERGISLTIENKEGFEIPGYTLASDGKYYKYNLEVDGDYYCPGNIIISNGVAISAGDPEKGLLIDYFYVDFQSKTLEDMLCGDAFADGFSNIEKIEVEKAGEKRRIKVKLKDEENTVLIEIDRDNQIIGYENHNLTQVEDNFLGANEVLTWLELPNLKKVGDFFLDSNVYLEQLELPNLQTVGYDFLENNRRLSRLELPNLQKIAAGFLKNNDDLVQLNLPNLIDAGHNFLRFNTDLEQLSLPNLQCVGHMFLGQNRRLKQLKLPKLQVAGTYFLGSNKNLTQLELPNLQKVGMDFLACNKALTCLELPSLKEADADFLGQNEVLTKLALLNLEEVKGEFLASNKALIQLELPNLKEAGNGFLRKNTTLKQVKLPSLQKVTHDFIFFNKGLTILKLPNLEEVGGGFLGGNIGLKQLELPKLKTAGNCFLCNNEALKILELPNLQRVGSQFLFANKILEQLEVPCLEIVRECFLHSNIALRKLNVSEILKGCFPSTVSRLQEIVDRNLNSHSDITVQDLGKATYDVTVEECDKALSAIKSIEQEKEADHDEGL